MALISRYLTQHCARIEDIDGQEEAGISKALHKYRSTGCQSFQSSHDPPYPVSRDTSGAVENSEGDWREISQLNLWSMGDQVPVVERLGGTVC